jgi:hypothetical protein
MILVSPSGSVRILRSRTAGDDGWNCSDGAAVSDDDAADPERWTAYSPEELAARLALASEVCDLGGFKELSGGLATWDACSGRPCVLPRLARLIR